MTSTLRTPLPESVESSLVKTIDEAFASESKDFRAAAVVWGRKQSKFERGLRSSKPPVPPKLQNSDKAKTQVTLQRIATALGLKFETPKATAPVVPVVETPAVEAVADTPVAKPDPKPSGRKPATRTADRARGASKKPAARAAA